MLDLLTVARLAVVVIDDKPRARYELLDELGAPMGTASWQPPSLEGELRGLLSSDVRYPFSVDVRDPSGAVVLQRRSDRERTGIALFRKTSRSPAPSGPVRSTASG